MNLDELEAEFAAEPLPDWRTRDEAEWFIKLYAAWPGIRNRLRLADGLAEAVKRDVPMPRTAKALAAYLDACKEPSG